MALKALQRQRSGRITELQQQYLDIVIGEYGGFVPYGEKAKIARRLDCNASYLSEIDGGVNPTWTKEYQRRLREAIPLANTAVQLGALQKLYEDSVEHRKKNGKPLTSKDPVDIISEVRKVSQGPAHLQALEAIQNVDQSTTFNFTGLSDESLSETIELLVKTLRSGGLEDVGEIIEGQFAEITADSIRGLEVGTGEEGLAEGQV